MWRGGLALCLASLLGACSFSQAPAPIRDRAPVVRPKPAPPPAFYRVKRGDTLFRIALDHGLDYRELAGWNGLDDPERVTVGQLLRLKPPVPLAGQPAPAAPTPNVPANSAPVLGEATPSTWVWPAAGPMVQGFAAVPGAQGIDIGGERGAPVRAAAEGKVVYTGAGLRGYGKLIIIKHSTAILSAYGHNERILVREGQWVKAGQQIAEMGDGDADRVKLHFEVREHGRPVDPMAYLPR